MIIGSKKLSKHIAALADPDAAKRRAAAEALSYGDARVIYPLIKALKDDNPGVQDAVMRSLISLGEEVTAYMVLPLLRDEPYLRNTAMVILKEIGPASIPLLKPLLKDKDDDIRKFAVDLICEIKRCDYPQELVYVLASDPNPNVRATAAKAIGVLHYKDALPHLIDSLKDEEWVCFSALESLARMNDESSIAPILALLNNPSPAIRLAAIDTLGEIGSLNSRNDLLTHLRKSEGLEKAVTIKSLVQIGIAPSMSEISGDLIDMFCNGEWDEKLIALKGLCVLKESRAIDKIIDVAGSLDPWNPDDEEKLLVMKKILRDFECSEAFIDILHNPAIRYRGKNIAIEVLGDLRCEKAIPHIRGLLESSIRDIRRAAVKALGEMHDEDTEQAFVDALDDEDGHVRQEAVSALGRIGNKKSFQPILNLISKEIYENVTEEAVKALLAIDPTALFSHLDELHGHAREAIGKYSNDIDTLLYLSRDDNLRTKVAAVKSLGKIRDERVYKRLTEAIHEEEPDIRKAAVMVMGELNCCYDEIKSALHDKDMRVRLCAVKTLSRLVKKDIINILSPMLYDEEIPVILSTIDALVHLGDKEATGILSPLLNHNVEVIREKACHAVDMLQHAESAG